MQIEITKLLELPAETYLASFCREPRKELYNYA
jgi:hypothetical protein